MRNKFLLALILALSNFGLSSIYGQTIPKTVATGIINGRAINLPKPEYPPAALAVKASGAVNVQVTIDEEGNVVSASAVSGHPLLRQAAEQSAREAKFAPTKLSGQPVKVTGVIIYNFVPSKAAANYEEKLQIMGLACFLTMTDLIPEDEWEAPTKEDLQEVPQIAKELIPLASITKTTSKEKKAEIIKKVLASLENKLTGANAWQFELGKEFAGILLELKKGGQDANKSIDETALKTKLFKIRDLIFTAPPDFPPEVLSKFKEIVKFADAPNFDSDENKYRFVQLITATLNTISPDSVK